MTALATRAGPHGYVHGWVKVGPGGLADEFSQKVDPVEFHSVRVDLQHQVEPTEAERRALGSYMGSSTAVNRALRGAGEHTEATRRVTAGLDSLIGRQRLTQDVHAVRGIQDATKVLGKHNFTGAVVRDKGYTSVSMDMDTAGEFMDPHGDNAVVFVRVPKGHHATVGVESEFELILPRGGSYKVTHDFVDPQDGVRKLFMEAM